VFFSQEQEVWMILDDYGQLKIVFFNHHVEMLTPPSLMVDHHFPDLNI
jgi:hypothetical protein